MKFKKIKQIKSLGVYQNFEWDTNCNEFQRYNFIYGWNYSGKSTLSRLFKCLEDKKAHKDYPQMEFEIETDNQYNYKTLSEKSIGNDFLIRVFNEEFIEENFDWNNENKEIDPILMLGKESKELEEKLKSKEEEKGKKDIEKKTKEEEKTTTETNRNNILRDKASEIRNILSITNPREFDKNNLESKINELKKDYEQSILSEDDLLKEKNTLNEEAREEIQIKIPDLNLNSYFTRIDSILQKNISVKKIIAKLKENEQLSTWVRKGIDLHKEETHCQFCGNSIPANRIEELQQHFSEEYDNLIKEIGDIEREINESFEKIDRFNLIDSANLFREFQSGYDDKKREFESCKADFIELRKALIQELRKKREKPFDVLKSTIDTNKFNEAIKSYSTICKAIYSIISQHNERAKSLEERKKQAKERIINHLTAKFIQDNDYFKIADKIDELEKSIETLGKEIETISNEIGNINKQIKRAAIGAGKLNEYLTSFFLVDELKIELTENDKYKLYRNNQIAKNLSTGEKNIISLIYFFTKLEESGFDKQNAIIFIDDPVSSLDSNHIHRVHSLLVEKMKEFGQIFITTHNFDFFNLLKDAYRYDLKNKQGCFYIIKRIVENNKMISKIENLPNPLLKFKSEYNYLFSILMDFHKKDGNCEQMFLIPNILRRFFEMYLFTRYPDGKSYKDKIKCFLGNDTSADKHTAIKIMDEYSHEENPDHAKGFPDIQEVKISVKFIIEKIEENDKMHHNALLESINPLPQSGK